MWSLDRIKPYENNPRINDDAVAPVVQSINEFGFRQPIVVDPDGVIIVGHTRWKAAKQLNLEEVPVHVARDLEPEAVRAYRIADNRTGENAQWDFDLLPIEIGALQQSGFDCELLGFDSDELAKLLSPGVEPGLMELDPPYCDVIVGEFNFHGTESFGVGGVLLCRQEFIDFDSPAVGHLNRGPESSSLKLGHTLVSCFERIETSFACDT
jgi:hypothetical protein